MEEDLKLDSLPEELLLYTICNFLQPKDVLIASQVSQRFYGLCNDTFVWKVFYHRQFPEELIPENEFRYSSSFKIPLTKPADESDEDEDIEFVRREFRAFRELLEAERAESAGNWKAKFQLRKNQEHKLRNFEQTTKWTVLTRNLKNEGKEAGVIGLLSGCILIAPVASLVYSTGFYRQYPRVTQIYMWSGILLGIGNILLLRFIANPKTNSSVFRSFQQFEIFAMGTWAISGVGVLASVGYHLWKNPDWHYRIGLATWLLTAGIWAFKQDWRSYMLVVTLPGFVRSCVKLEVRFVAALAARKAGHTES